MAVSAPLDHQRRKFAEEWVIDRNLVRAYRAAGYIAATDEVARQEALLLLVSEDIAPYVEFLLEEESERDEALEQQARRLAPNHRRFAEEWVIDFSHARAYTAAGFNVKSNRSAVNGAVRLLAREDVRAYVRSLMNAQTRQRRLTAGMVLEQMRRIAFSDIRRVIEPNILTIPPKKEGDEPQLIDCGIKLRPLSDIPEEDAVAISEIVQKPSRHGVVLESVKMESKLPALAKLMRYFALDQDPQQVLNRARALGFKLVDQYAEQLAVQSAETEDELPQEE